MNAYFFGSIYRENIKFNKEDAVYLCLTQSEGLMVFSIVQIINYDLWNEIKKELNVLKTISE